MSGSNRIIWTDAAIEDLRRRLSGSSPGEEGYEFYDDVDETEEIVDPGQYEEPEDTPTPEDPVVIPIPAPVVSLDFPWPISVKSSSFVVSGGKTVGVDVVLTWADVVGADAYEVRVRGN